MEKIALFPGSFDPITIGHTDIVERAAPLFDQFVIAIGNNTNKDYLFPLEKRLSWIETLYKDQEHINVESYQGLTINYCKEVGAQYMIRGLRSAADFEFEKIVAQLNQSMDQSIETIFIPSRPQLSHISSTIVREIIVNDGNIQDFVPPTVYNNL